MDKITDFDYLFDIVNINMNKKTVISVLSLIPIIIISSILIFKIYESKNGIFYGKITGVENCFVAIGTSSCTWIVDGKKVTWSVGSAPERQKSGEVIGLQIGKEDIGKRVKVKAELINTNEYSIATPGYYIKEQ